MLVAAFDVLRDDSRIFSKNLKQAGVTVEYIERPRTHVLVMTDQKGLDLANLKFKEFATRP